MPLGLLLSNVSRWLLLKTNSLTNLSSGVVTLHEDQTLEEMHSTRRKARAFRANVRLYKMRAFTDEFHKDAACSAKHVREACVCCEA